MSLIKYFAATMISLTLIIVVARFHNAIKHHNFSKLENLPIDLFSLSIQFILFKTAKSGKVIGKVLKIIWPLLIFLGITGFIYFYKGYLFFKEIEDVYKENPVTLYYPLVYSLLLIVYGLLIGYMVYKKAENVRALN